MSTSVAKLAADGVAQSCAWRESFRLNVSDAEAQVLVLSVCSKQLLKDARLASVSMPLRATERDWMSVDVAESDDAPSQTIDGVECWLPTPLTGAPDARVRICIVSDLTVVWDRH